MNIAMQLTLDSLVHALRRTAHDVADAAEQGYRHRVTDDDVGSDRTQPAEVARRNGDDRSRD